MKNLYRGIFVALVCLTVASYAHCRDRSTCFNNQSAELIYVDRLICDGKYFPIPVGYLIPDASSKGADMFPAKIPVIFTIEYRKNSSELLRQDLDGKQVARLISSTSKRNDITLHFIYTENQTFIAKIEEETDRNDVLHHNKLWPDEADPTFQKYKALVRCAYDGDVRGVKQSLESGAVFARHDDPVGLTPLEWTVRWDHQQAFEELLKVLPTDYPVYRFGSCIMLATQDGHTEILKKLLAQPLAKQIKNDQLQEIFYRACYLTKSPASLETLLAFYPVGVNFRVRDYGHTLLFVAVQGGNTNVAEWLLKHGADKEVSLQSGLKLIDSTHDEKMLQLLLAKQPLEGQPLVPISAPPAQTRE